MGGENAWNVIPKQIEKKAKKINIFFSPSSGGDRKWQSLRLIRISAADVGSAFQFVREAFSNSTTKAKAPLPDQRTVRNAAPA